VNGVIYVACSGGMRALSLNGTTFAPRTGWTVNSNAVAPPIFAGGLVWSAGYNNGVHDAESRRRATVRREHERGHGVRNRQSAAFGIGAAHPDDSASRVLRQPLSRRQGGDFHRHRRSCFTGHRDAFRVGNVL